MSGSRIMLFFKNLEPFRTKVKQNFKNLIIFWLMTQLNVWQFGAFKFQILKVN